MANSWNGPQLGSPIRTDVPELQKKLIALLKQDPTSVANIPSGAKRLVNTSGVQWQVQQYNGSSWAAIGKLMHDVDKLDGYHAAITPNANTVAVRNADKKLEGDITGNAATASSATTLSETLPVNKGGTGATTSAQARTNLGVPPTSHASSNTTYGLGSNANYGHVRGDGVTTNVVSGEVVAKDIALGGDSADPATKRGYLADTVLPWWDGGADVVLPDFDTATKLGNYHVLLKNDQTLNYPPEMKFGSTGYNDGILTVERVHTAINISSYYRYRQTLKIFGTYSAIFTRIQQPFSTGSWYSWQRLIDNGDVATATVAGIMKPGDGLSAGSSGVINLDDTVVRTSGNQTVDGTKTFTSVPVVHRNSPAINLKENDFVVGELPSSNQYWTVGFYDKNNTLSGRVLHYMNANGDSAVYLDNTGADGTTRSIVSASVSKDNIPYASCPTPKADSNTNHIATTEWVRKYTLPTSALIPSFATSMTGYLLCNGAAVSRTTYANLFSIIGTKFGAGDGSNTFNLPDFRDKTLWGANGNLMATIAAGLPNITGSISSLSTGVQSDVSPTVGGAFSVSSTSVNGGRGGDFLIRLNSVTFNASRSSTIYGGSTTVRPPAIAVNIFIKY